MIVCRYPCSYCGAREHVSAKCLLRRRRDTRPDVRAKDYRKPSGEVVVADVSPATDEPREGEPRRLGTPGGTRRSSGQAVSASRAVKSGKRSWNSKEKHDYSGEGGRLRRVAELAAELQAFSDQGFREGRWR